MSAKVDNLKKVKIANHYNMLNEQHILVDLVKHFVAMVFCLRSFHKYIFCSQSTKMTLEQNSSKLDFSKSAMETPVQYVKYVES